MDERAVKAARLREARKDAGFESAEKAADAFGWKAAGYRHHENETRTFPPIAAKKYARAFKVNAGWLMAMEGVPKKRSGPQSGPTRLGLSGSVQAGLWRESMRLPDEEAEKLYWVLPSPFPPNVRRMLLRVDGNSMDMIYPPGYILDCYSIFDLGVKPDSGDDVIVERRREDGLREFTVKTYQVDEEGDGWLLPQSRQAGFAPIHIGKPDEDHVTDDGVQVIAVVLGEYSPKRLRDLERFQGGAH